MVTPDGNAKKKKKAAFSAERRDNGGVPLSSHIGALFFGRLCLKSFKVSLMCLLPPYEEAHTVRLPSGVWQKCGPANISQYLQWICKVPNISLMRLACRLEHRVLFPDIELPVSELRGAVIEFMAEE